MKICVLGTGYVGLVVGVCMANNGHTVCCVDTNQQKINGLLNGILPIYEPGLDDLVATNVNNGRLSFSTEGDNEISNAEVIYIAVGTPSAADGSANMEWVYAAAKQIAENANNQAIIVIKSTVPVGTADAVRKIQEKHSSKVLDVVSNPEFLREGLAIEDFREPDRIVVGYRHEVARKIMENMYSSFIQDGHQVYFMDNRSAEITKYAANSLLATKISFANELARLCDAVGADIDAVRLGTGSDSRIGPKFLYAGVGYGGSCFPKDVKALIHTGRKHGVTLQIAQAVENVNAEQKKIIVQKICNDFGEDLSGKKFAVWGLAFKPETDDIREAPALSIIPSLLRMGGRVVAYDPEAMSHIKEVFGDSVTLVDTKEQALNEADALILLTEWKEFKSPQWSQIRDKMRGAFVYDGRNIYNPKNVINAGLSYRGIGRGVL
jgi:UDPglucose 6-dehydrogenase